MLLLLLLRWVPHAALYEGALVLMHVRLPTRSAASEGPPARGGEAPGAALGFPLQAVVVAADTPAVSLAGTGFVLRITFSKAKKLRQLERLRQTTGSGNKKRRRNEKGTSAGTKDHETLNPKP